MPNSIPNPYLIGNIVNRAIDRADDRGEDLQRWADERMKRVPSSADNPTNALVWLLLHAVVATAWRVKLRERSRTINEMMGSPQPLASTPLKT